MIIELMGQPASGKTLLISSLSKTYDCILLDSLYNKKNLINKLFFLFKYSKFLNRDYRECKKIVKQALSDRNHKMRSFFLRQFRLDYILINCAKKLSDKGQTCVLSENFYNLFAYIFFYNKTKQKRFLFSKLLNLLPNILLYRDFVVQIKVNIENNLAFKSFRAGVSKEEFAKDTNFYKDFSLVDDAQLESLKLLKAFVKNTIVFRNDYNTISQEEFVSIFDRILKKEK